MPAFSSLSSQYPFLLFPVQVQVKFVQNPAQFVDEHPGRTTHELRIRLYPDQLGLNTHEDDLTAAEVVAGQTYWKTAPNPAAGTPHAIGPWRVLVGRYGSNRARWILQQTTPTNLAQVLAGTAPGPTFPSPGTQPARWMQPATSLVMPDYFSAMLYTQVQEAGEIENSTVQELLLPHLKEPYSPTLIADATTEFLRLAKQVDGERIAAGPLQVGPAPQSGTSGLNDEAQLAWLVDFEQALKQGLAIVVPLSPEEYQAGFKRLIVLGVRNSPDLEENAADLAQIFLSHLRTGGLELVPQGTPTNNTDGAAAGFSSAERSDAEASFAALVRGSLFEQQAPDKLLDHRDGQRFVDALGLSFDDFNAIPHGDGTDGREARLLNRALWPATYGYFLEEMMRPFFSPAAIDWTRHFFQDYVLARGAVPAFRVHNEPYGVLTTTQFSAWVSPSSLGPYGQQLAQVLQQLDVTWTERLNQAVAYPAVLPGSVAGATPPPSQQNLLTTLGSDATSVEYYQRYLLGPNVVDTLNAHAQEQQQTIWARVADAGQPDASLLRTAGRFGTPAAPQNPLYTEFLTFFGGDRFEWKADKWPRLFDQTFQAGFQQIAHTFADVPVGPLSRLGSVVDDVPLSETAAVRPFFGKSINYLHWLATSSFDDIRRENFAGLYGGHLPAGFAPPSALLYRLLRHAVLLQYWQAAADAVQLPAEQRPEKELFNVLTQDQARWEVLYQEAEGGVLHEALQRGQGSQGAQLVAYLGEVAALATVPTARLERVLAEHLDLGNYRLDAWRTALVAYRLGELRGQNGPGNYLGAFGWLEDLQPTANEAPPTPEEEETGRLDPDNLGFIHAPSLNHATAAAILRQGYKSRQHTVDASDPAADRLSVNLSSERVRQALVVLEGVRAGQSLSVLLGQEFEQALSRHAGTVAGMPYALYVQNFRQKFPLTNENVLASQPAPSSAVVDEVAARQVVDGLALLQAGSAAYPFGDPGLPVKTAGAESAAFVAAVEQVMAALLDTLDALGDLTVGESMFQAVLGNSERAGALLESIAKGKFPVSPEIVHPRAPGVALTHRVLAHLPQANPAVLADWGTLTPLARATPGLNRWLAGFFGSPLDVVLPYSGGPAGTSDTIAAQPSEAPSGALTTLKLSQAGLQPVDLLYLLDQGALRRGSALDTYLRYAIAPDAAGADSLAIDYTSPGAETLRRLLPLAGRLRQLVAGSRAAGPADLQTTASAGATRLEPGIDATELTTRFNGLLQTARTLIASLPAATSVYWAEPLVLARETIVRPTLPTPHQLRPLLRQAAAFGVPEALQALTAPDSLVLQSATLVRAALSKRVADAQQALNKRTASVATDAAASVADPNEAGAYAAAGEALFGATFRLTLCFTLPTAAATRYQQALAATGLLRHHTANPLIMPEWLQGAAAVRDQLDHLGKVLLLNNLVWDEAAGHALPELQPAQLAAEPVAGDYWLGVPYPATHVPAGDTVSLVQLLPAGYSATGSQCALWLDEWTEVLPAAEQTTAVAFHYDQPNTSAPQSTLLVVAPDSENQPEWKFEQLLGAVNETLDLAKKRTVEPDALAFTHLATVLPALVAPVSQHGVTFTLDYRRVRQSAQFQELVLGLRNSDGNAANQ